MAVHVTQSECVALWKSRHDYVQQHGQGHVMLRSYSTTVSCDTTGACYDLHDIARTRCGGEHERAQEYGEIVLRAGRHATIVPGDMVELFHMLRTRHGCDTTMSISMARSCNILEVTRSLKS